MDVADTNSEAAALLEEIAAERVPDDKPRVRGLLCRSAVSLWLMAGDRDHAIAFAQQLMGQLLPGFAADIRRLLGLKAT